MSGQQDGLSAEERDALLRTCPCGHSPNDHGALAGCWLCPEENRECEVTFEDMLVERMGFIVDARAARRESEAADKALRDAANAMRQRAFVGNASHWRAHAWGNWLRARADSVAQGREEGQ